MREFHPDVRDYTIAVLRERLGATQTALDHAADRFYENLKANGACVCPVVAVFASRAAAGIWSNGFDFGCYSKGIVASESQAAAGELSPPLPLCFLASAAVVF